MHILVMPCCCATAAGLHQGAPGSSESYPPERFDSHRRRNEEANLPAKRKPPCSKLPADQTQVVIVSDGSADQTASILREHASTVVSIIVDKSNGKASALNEAVKRATGEILVFLDARQRVEPDAVGGTGLLLRRLDGRCRKRGIASETKSTESASDALGLYWKIEKTVRKLESASGSVIGVTGAIYAIRRDLYTEMPTGTILDDVFVPMHVARLGRRVVFQPSAIARDQIFSENGKEFSRKVRTLTGNYQLLRLAPWMLSPSNPLFSDSSATNCFDSWSRHCCF